MTDTTIADVGTTLVAPPSPAKPGYLTTEFWSVVAFQVVSAIIAIAALFGTNLDGSKLQPLEGVAALVAAGLANAFYSHSRGKVKAAAVTATATLALPAIANDATVGTNSVA